MDDSERELDSVIRDFACVCAMNKECVQQYRDTINGRMISEAMKRKHLQLFEEYIANPSNKGKFKL